MRIYNQEAVPRAVDRVIEAAPGIALAVAVLYMLELQCEGEVIGSKRIVVNKMPAQVKGTNDLKF
ncbi:MAG: hypothetical protein NTU79_06965 [Planctomycetota bacterium]|nr:hypothetical protein [Planctomycetota bacterium]